MNTSIYLKHLVQLALVDNSFVDEEMKFIINLGLANGLSEEEINLIIKDGLQKKDSSQVEDFAGLSFDQRFEYLVSLIQLMKIDGKIYLSEINYIKLFAKKLGFKKDVIAKVITRVHKDPGLSMEWDILKKEVVKSLEPVS